MYLSQSENNKRAQTSHKKKVSLSSINTNRNANSVKSLSTRRTISENPAEYHSEKEQEITIVKEEEITIVKEPEFSITMSPGKHEDKNIGEESEDNYDFMQQTPQLSP